MSMIITSLWDPSQFSYFQGLGQFEQSSGNAWCYFGQSRRTQEVDISPKKRVGNILPWSGITNTLGQNTRSSHLHSGMSEWRGHHYAGTRCWSDIGAEVAGQCGDLHALTRDLVQQYSVGQSILIHVQPREDESQLACGETTVAWASFPKESSVGGLWELAVE